MTNFIRVNVEGKKEQVNYKFYDDVPVKDKPGKSAGVKCVEFLVACMSCKSFKMDNNEIYLNAEDGQLANGYYMDVKDGGDIELDETGEGKVIYALLILTERQETIGRLIFYEDMNRIQVAEHLGKGTEIIGRNKCDACKKNGVGDFMELKHRFIMQYPEEVN